MLTICNATFQSRSCMCTNGARKKFGCKAACLKLQVKSNQILQNLNK